MTVTTDEAGTELDVPRSEDEELISAALESELEVAAADAPVLNDTVWRLWLATATSRGSAATDNTAERVRRRVIASDRMLVVDSSALRSWREALRYHQQSSSLEKYAPNGRPKEGMKCAQKAKLKSTEGEKLKLQERLNCKVNNAV